MDSSAPKSIERDRQPNSLLPPMEPSAVAALAPGRLLAWTLLALVLALAPVLALPVLGVQLSQSATLALYAATALASVFVVFYAGIVVPTLHRVRVLERHRAQLENTRQQLERDLGEGQAALAEIKAQLKGQVALREGAQALAQQLESELEGKVTQRTAHLERQARDLQSDLAQLHDTLNSVAEAVVVCDLTLSIVTSSEGAAQLYGWNAQEVVGRNFLEVVTAGSTAGTTAEVLQEAQQNGRWRGELRQVDSRGRPLLVDLRVLRCPASSTLPARLLLLATDLTGRKQRELQTSRQGRMDSASALASGLAHELNNTLAPVVLSAQMLRTRHPEPDDHNLITTIEAGAERCAEVIKQALVFARGLEGERVPIDPARLVKEMSDISRETFPRNVQVVCDLQPAVWNIKGDPTQLHQVLLKLCVNARDAMAAGGVLTLRARNLTLDDRTAASHRGLKPGPYVAIEVQDSAPPLSEAAKERILEPFFTAKERPGWGLGLSVALGVVRSHGGAIDVQSGPGPGTTFSALLPALAETAAHQEQVAPALAGQGGAVLVVEEQPGLREMTRATLAANGYEVLAAADGLEALGMLAQCQGRIKIVLTSLTAPYLDGPGLARAARRIDPHLRIIASSAWGTSAGDTEKVAELQSLGISRFLAKPFSTDELLRAIRADAK